MRSYLTKLNEHLLNTEKPRLRDDARRRSRAPA